MSMVFPRMKLHSSPPPTSIQLPSPKDVHLWYVKPSEVKSESLLKQYFDILSPCERENVLRMRGEELKKSALLARALVRTTISRYHIDPKITPKSLKFRKNEHGKPEVQWLSSDDSRQPPLKFNISHTSSLIACGVTVDSRIGIDVEEKYRTIRHNVLSFARRFFSQHEVQFLCGVSDPEEQRMKFIKLWTLKEAYVKALGKGFSGAPFKTFTIRFKDVMDGGFNSSEDLCPKASKVIVDSFDESTDLTCDWKFSLLELASSHYAAICTEKHDVSEGTGNVPVKLTVWKTIPFLEDECVSDDMASTDTFPAADIDKELNPGKNKDFEVDPVSSDVARETEEQFEAARKLEEQEKKKNDQLQSLKTVIIVSGVVVAVVGAVFAITKKLKEK